MHPDITRNGAASVSTFSSFQRKSLTCTGFNYNLYSVQSGPEGRTVKASFLDLRRRMRDILRALDRNESVTLLYRGEKKAVMYPVAARADAPLTEHPAFGV